MKPAEVTVKYNRSYTAQTDGIAEVENFIHALKPLFQFYFEIVYSDSDAHYLEEIDGIYENDDNDAFWEFLMIDEENGITREFDSFQYEFKFEPGDDGMDKYTFSATALKTVDEFLSIGDSVKDVFLQFDVTFNLNDSTLEELRSSFPDLPEELFVEVSPGEVIPGGIPEETEEVTESIETVDVCDSETLKLVRDNKEPMPYYMVFVEGGRLSQSDSGDSDYELNVSDFYMSKYPVTFEEYDRFCEETGRGKPDDTGCGRGDIPVVNVTYIDAIAYCRWMTKKTGIRTELPTLAQWRFAAKGGNESLGFNYPEIDALGVGYTKSEREQASTRPFPVGQKQPNELGLYDMWGNIWEFTREIHADYFEHHNRKDPLCRANTHGVSFSEFINEAIDLPAGELESAFENWTIRQYAKNFHKIKKYAMPNSIAPSDYFQFAVITEGLDCEGLSDPESKRGMFFFRQYRDLGFRIVMYP